MLRRRAAARAGVLLAALLAGCSGGEGRQAPRAEAAATFDELRALADTRLAERDWTGALEAYEQALRLRPEDVGVRYRAGVALSQLDRASDAEAAFRWIVDHAPGHAEEARLAAAWLRANTGQGATAARPAWQDDASEGGGRVEGRTEWARLPGEAPPPRLQIVLSGEGPGPARRFGASVRLGDRYTIGNVPPGSYRLAAQAGMTRLWDTTVSVEEGRTTTVDLVPASSVAPPDALARRAS